ncbi:MAG: hypothetical protein WBZ42_08825 [Halobacteriota archaeon]
MKKVVMCGVCGSSLLMLSLNIAFPFVTFGTIVLVCRTAAIDLLRGNEIIPTGSRG